MNNEARVKTRSGMGVKIMLWSLILIPVLYVSSCSYISSRKSKSFEAINVGDSEVVVSQRMGPPSVREKPGTVFSRYASEPCREPCVERLWYENRLSLDTEAWSFEMSAAGQVIKKNRWVSP